MFFPKISVSQDILLHAEHAQPKKHNIRKPVMLVRWEFSGFHKPTFTQSTVFWGKGYNTDSLQVKSLVYYVLKIKKLQNYIYEAK